MDLDLPPELAARHGLHQNQLGWLIEQDLDRVVLVPSRGRLHPYLPPVDVHRVDRAYAWDGVGPPMFVQIKGSAAQPSDGRWIWTIRAGHFTPYDRFHVVACIVDPSSGHLQDPIWTVPSRDLLRVATRSGGSVGPRLELRASATGHDALTRYRTTLDKLWESFAPAPEVRVATLPAEFPVIRREQGGLYELAQVVELLRGGESDLCVYRPASDISGRDLLIQLVDTPRAIYVQTKGTGRVSPSGIIECAIRRHTFRPADDFWLSFFYYQHERQAFSRTAG